MARQAFKVPVNPYRQTIDSLAAQYASMKNADITPEYRQSFYESFIHDETDYTVHDSIVEACDLATNKAQWTKLLYEYCGGLSEPSKMPCYSWSIPAHFCTTGSKLHKQAGTTCEACYALGGRYVMPNVKIAMARRLITFHYNYSPNENYTTFAMVLARFLTWQLYNPTPGIDARYFRWFDSGDLQDYEMLESIVRIAEMVPDVTFWLPTRESYLLNMIGQVPQNLIIRYSTPVVGTLSKRQNSTMVVSDLAVLPDNCKVCPATSNPVDHTCNGNNNCRSCWTTGHIGYILH